LQLHARGRADAEPDRMDDEPRIGFRHRLRGDTRIADAGLMAVAHQHEDALAALFRGEILRSRGQGMGDGGVSARLQPFGLAYDLGLVRGDRRKADQQGGVLAIPVLGRRLVAIGAQRKPGIAIHARHEIGDGALGGIDPGLPVGQLGIHAARSVEHKRDTAGMLRQRRRRGEHGDEDDCR
jgi:hypothetical protein